MTVIAGGTGAGRARRFGIMLTKMAIAAAIVGGVALGAAVLQGRADAGAVAAEEAVPLPVLTMRLQAETGHVETRRFAGRIEPARRTALGFEQGGLITAILVEEGARVAAGAALARRDTAMAENRRTQLLAARDRQLAALELARLTEARQEGLGAAATNPQRRDEARLGREQAEAALAEIEAARAGVEIELAKATLRAPFAGTVAARMLDEGAVAAAGAPVIDLIETATPRARIGLSPEVAAGLEPGTRHALDTDAGRLPARLVALRPDIDTASRTVTALFEFEGALSAAPGGAAGPGLRLGEIVTFAAEIAHPGSGYWVPLTALVDAGRGTWAVYALDAAAAEPVIRRESVQVVSVAGESAFVAGPLPPGTHVVRDGTNRVRPGQAVRLLLARD